MPYPTQGDLGMRTLDFVITALKDAKYVGMSYCIDNLKVYQGVRRVVDISPTDYGKYVDTNAQKVVDIKEGSHVKSKDQLLEEALAMKIGVDYALIKNERVAIVNNSENEVYNGIYGAPLKSMF